DYGSRSVTTLKFQSTQLGPSASKYKPTITTIATTTPDKSRKSAAIETNREVGLALKKSAHPEKSHKAKAAAGTIHDRTPRRVAAQAIAPLPPPTAANLRGANPRASAAKTEKTFSSG